MENKQCYKCLKLLTRIESNSGSMCKSCHTEMLEKCKKDLRENRECCDYNGQLYWF
jgi:hypothetical protein